MIKVWKYNSVWYLKTDWRWLQELCGWPKLVEKTQVTATVGSWWRWYLEGREHKKFLDNKNKR